MSHQKKTYNKKNFIYYFKPNFLPVPRVLENILDLTALIFLKLDVSMDFSYSG